MEELEADLPENHDPDVVGEAGFPPGGSPDEFVANLMTFLKEAAAKLQASPPRERPTPSDLRFRAAFHEAADIELELKKGANANPIIVQRANLLRQDVWSRWRAGEHGGSPDAPLTQAISKLADVADRQLTLLSGQTPVSTIHAPSLSPAIPRENSPAVRHDPPPPRPVLSDAPMFSQITEEYLEMQEKAGAARGAISTTRLRAFIFQEIVGDQPFDSYLPKQLQDYVYLLQHLPVEYTREGKEHEALQHMSPKWLMEWNRQHSCWETLALKTMQDGYVQVVKTILATAALEHPFKNPFAGLRIRWPKKAKPSVKREALDYEKLDRAFELGVASGYLDDAMIPPICLLSTRRIGIIPWIRGCDIDRKHGVDIVRVNGIVYDKMRGKYARVPYKTNASLQFFVLHKFFRDIGFVDWAMTQGDNFIFAGLQSLTDASDTASKRVNRLLLRAGAKGMNIEVGHSMRHGGKDLLIEEEVDPETRRRQMGHEVDDVHANYGEREELRRQQCRTLYEFALPKEIDWNRFKGLDFEAMARKPRQVGRPKRGKASDPAASD
ncbi:MAG: hypothetical protein KIT48_04620 [Pseudolabrys sp.]|nr:hypothetical protein [Pseudolabrys sp.]